MIRFLAIGTSAGLVVPLLFALASWVLERIPSLYGPIGDILYPIQLLLWPSSVLLMGTAGDEGISLGPLSIAIAINVLLYAVLAIVIWWGLTRQRWILFVVAAVMLAVWYRLFTL